MTTQHTNRQLSTASPLKKPSITVSLVALAAMALVATIVTVTASEVRQPDHTRTALTAPPVGGPTDGGGIRDRRLSPTGRTGIIDSDPGVTYGDSANSLVTVSGSRRLSPTGRTGIIDSDPAVTYGDSANSLVTVSGSRRLSPTGRTGIIDSDPAVTYLSN